MSDDPARGKEGSVTKYKLDLSKDTDVEVSGKEALHRDLSEMFRSPVAGEARVATADSDPGKVRRLRAEALMEQVQSTLTELDGEGKRGVAAPDGREAQV
jgi:hypothetical protein